MPSFKYAITAVTRTEWLRQFISKNISHPRCLGSLYVCCFRILPIIALPVPRKGLIFATALVERIQHRIA